MQVSQRLPSVWVRLLVVHLIPAFLSQCSQLYQFDILGFRYKILFYERSITLKSLKTVLQMKKLRHRGNLL